MEATQEGLAVANGCYVFSMRAGRGIRPWYVGQARGKDGFRQEVFRFHKLVQYNDVLAKKKGTPLVHLLARCTPKGKLSNHVNQSELNWLETMLIGLALQENADLCNAHGTGFLRNVSIPGITGGGGSGRHSKSRASLRVALGLKK